VVEWNGGGKKLMVRWAYLSGFSGWMAGKINMIVQKKRPDIATLVQLCERKSEYLTITRTPEAWTVTGKGQEAAPVAYQSIEDALMAFIIGDDHHGDGGE
jgi:hypothetical protein